VRDVIDYQTADNVAAFIAEPVMGEGGIIVPHPDYFRRVKKILDEREILFVADEVQTGFGRTGKLFGIEHYGVEPDIMAMAKGIADGFPLAGFIARSEIADTFQPGEHLSTFGGNPVCCAAALASLNVIENDNLVERSAVLGQRVLRQLREFATSHSQVGDVRGLGLMLGIELVSNQETKAPFPELANTIKGACRDLGVLIGVGGFFGNVMRIQPPLVITEEQFEFVIEVLDDAFDAAAV
jgi:4-aminobutyrate aminotransferase-like enzyme